MTETTVKSGPSRRDFLKIGGAAALLVQAGGLVAAGNVQGSSAETYTGWESFNPATQFFNRKPFEFEGPAHLPVADVRRPSHMTDYVFGRVATFQKAYETNPTWTPADRVEDLGVPDPLVAFYKEYPERLEWDYRTFSETIPTHDEDYKVYGNYYKLADAYSSGFTAHAAYLPTAGSPPEESDFMEMQRGWPGPKPIGDPIPFKDEEKAAEFIKEVAHRYGATLVGITKAKIDYFYSEGWAGCPEDYDYSKLPEHWQYVIVIGVPMEWDTVLASPQASTSYEGYDRVSTAAVRLEGVIKNLGYPARASTPMTYYDMIVPPFAIEAGLGEVSRPGYCVTPELGSNCRLAAVVTNLPMATDKPIKFGVEEFCNSCKICAEQCPSGAISMADSPDEQDWGTGPVLRGYKHWYINNGACYNFWRESMGPLGCRLCVAVCPYSRKDNWVHQLAREVDPRDPTGITRESLLFMQKNFFDYPEAVEYRRVGSGGHFASYRPEPAFLHAEDFLDIPITSPHED
ncbi:MAG: reductive dehalogenase [Caldilineaceae bacterium]|nr:reductive dehalogenase [Caldilineaceae bacterium]